MFKLQRLSFFTNRNSSIIIVDNPSTDYGDVKINNMCPQILFRTLVIEV